MDEYITLEEAQQRLLDASPTVSGTEMLPLAKAQGRVLSEDIFAKIAQPPFDRSPLDGYAMRHEDTAGATAAAPARLRIAQRLYAGSAPTGPLSPGECARVMTGAKLPSNATCVVRQEDVREEDSAALIPQQMEKHQNYVFAGEDVTEGQRLLQRGDLLSAAALGVLAGQGFTEVPVFRRPRVAVISGGDELAPPGTGLPEGKIYDSNAVLLAARVRDLGGEAVPAHCEDDPDSLVAMIEGLMEEFDLVLTTGGVSVGEKDYMPAVGRRIAGELIFRGVGIKPGAPALAAAKDGKLLISLSGNPFAAAATFELLAAPSICKMAGRAQPLPQRSTAITQSAFPKESIGRRFIRARLTGCKVAIPDGHASGMLGSLIGCNCLIDIPSGSPSIPKGAEVDVALML